MYIKPTIGNYDLSLWTALQKNNPTKAMICIISKSEPLEGVSAHVKKILLTLNKLQKLR
jgi:hypothetical protein